MDGDDGRSFRRLVGDGDTESSSPSTAGWHNLPDDFLAWFATGYPPPATTCSSPPSADHGTTRRRGSPRSPPSHLCGPCGSWVLCVPGMAVKKRFVGSHRGAWIVAMDDHPLVIVNLFSGAKVQLTTKQKMIASIPTVKGPHNIKKIIFS